MKKVVSVLACAACLASLFAARSFKNNTYQKLADEYTKKSEAALDAGQYADSVEYAKKAEENARLSKEYIRAMMARGQAEDAIKLAQSDLEYEGKGHTASIHSNDMEHVRYAGENLTVSRLIVNQSSSTGAGGSLYNGFAPTTTLGCGSWGNNSISENLNYTHLINVSQIGLYNKDKKVPTDEEIWA